MNSPQHPTAIAITGMAFRFPGGVDDENSMWRMLSRGKRGISRIPADRWPVEELQHPKRSEPGRSVTFAAGILSEADQFDAGFFGISPREAAWLDPQQRLLLEMAYEAMEDAGLRSSALAGSQCGVYIGISGMEYGQHALADLASMTAHSMTGNTLSIAANRLSYVFDLRGPSMAVDTACSSSLVALHQACQALRHGEIPIALAGGVSLLMHPYSFIGFSHASMLSASGQCRPFDAAADGYVRGEGGAVLLLKPLAQAQKDGDHIHAVILASGVNADGARKSGLTIPSAEAQAELMRDVLDRSGLTPEHIDFIEAHGTGTPVGDPVEAASIGTVYGTGRQQPIPVSSVKANFGHLEPASGMAGLVKAILALKRAELPPMPLEFTPNPHIDFQKLHVVCAASGMPLQGRAVHAAAINSFGFGGVNAHLIVQSMERPVREDRQDASALPPLFLSARTDEALRDLAARYAGYWEKAAPAFYDMAYTAAFHRERWEKRLALSVSSPEEVAPALRAFAEGGNPPSIVTEGVPDSGNGIVFVYTGNGSQWAGMGRNLYAESPVFRQMLDELDRRLLPLAGFSPVRMLLHGEEGCLDDTTISQPLLFAIQLGITSLLQEQGIRPQAVAGHSVGEIAAAWAAGALSLEQAVRIIHARSCTQGKTRGMGRMAAAAVSVQAAGKIMAQYGLENDLEIAGINAPDDITLSGSPEALSRFGEQMRQHGIFFRHLALDYAFHSRRMESVRDELALKLQALAPSRDTDVLFVSTVTGRPRPGSTLNREYWWQNVRQPVDFAAAVQELGRRGFRIFVEIGPHPILQHYIRENLTAVGVKGRILSSLSRDDDHQARLAHLAARLHLLSEQTELQALFPRKADTVSLPRYPWQKQRCWYPRTSECRPARKRRHPLLGWPLDAACPTWENILDPARDGWLADHKVGGAIVFPGAGYVEIALAAARFGLGKEQITLEFLDITTPLVFENGHAQCVRCSLDPEDGSIRICSRPRLGTGDWTRHARARAIVLPESTPADITPPGGTPQVMSHEALYALTAKLGLDYGVTFRVVDELRMTEGCFEADLIPSREHEQNSVLPPAVLDACFHSLAGVHAVRDAGAALAFLPIGTGSITVCSARPVCRIIGRSRRCGRRSLTAEFLLLDDAARPVARVRNCRFRAAPLARAGLERVDAWTIRPWLSPLATRIPAPLPPLEELCAVAAKALAGCAPQREVWFKQILPLMEAMTLSAAAHCLKEPPDNGLQSAACEGWLRDLLDREGLLPKTDADGAAVPAPGAGLPTFPELWSEAFRLAPQFLPALLPLGRVCRRLGDVLRGELDGKSLLKHIREAVVTRESRHLDPAVQGTDTAITAIIRHLATLWPAHRPLRILEVAAAPGALPETLDMLLQKDAFSYLLALPDDAALAQAKGRYGQHPAIRLITTDGLQGEPAPRSFDIVLFRHTLHSFPDYDAMLRHIRTLLADGGLLLVAERYPDWSTDLVEGLDPAWWRTDPHSGRVLSSLSGPQAWQGILETHGFDACRIFREPAAEDLAEGAFLLLAAAPAHRDAAADTEEQQPAVWLLLTDAISAPLAENVSRYLLAHGQQAVCSCDAADIAAAPADHVVFMLGHGDSTDKVTDTLDRLRHCAHLCMQQEACPPRLWILTRGGSLAAVLPDDHTACPAQCAVTGLGRVIMQEYGGLRCTLVDIPATGTCPDLAARLGREFLTSTESDEILLTQQARYVLRVDSMPQKAVRAVTEQRCRLDFTVPGRLNNLRWQPDTVRTPEAGQVEVRVMAVGLNFRDVMLTMGLLTDDAVENGFAGPCLGLEFSGIITRVGEGVQDLRTGDHVAGFASNCFASHVTPPAHAVTRIPDDWPFETAAAIPTVFFTAWYALRHLARLQPGESVLIHGAAGGVGIAAIQIARFLGATVFATAGSDEKRDFLRLMGVAHIFDSRSLSFADDVLSATGGQGVDAVLNSLAGEAMRRSISLLKPFGRFLELGKRDFVENTGIGLRPFRENISYFAIDVDQLLTARPEIAARLFQEVMQLLRSKDLVPPPCRSFPADQTIAAFRAMQQAQHIGKIVVDMSALPPVHAGQTAPEAPDSARTWLVSGGLGGFGLATARHLARRGIRNLVLVGRRGMSTPGVEELLEEFRTRDVNVRAEACDVTDPAAVRSLIGQVTATMPPLGGVIHAAAVFDDRWLTQMDRASLDKVISPKLRGAWNLHEATRHLPLTHFVLYSSISVALGNPGQANYVAANAGLEGLTRLRLALGLPALCIAWGPVGDAGYLARHDTVKKSLTQHLGKAPLTTSEAMNALDRVFDESGLHILANISWQTVMRMFPESSPRFGLVTHSEDPAALQDTPDIRQLLAEKSPADVLDIIRRLSIDEVAQVLGLATEQVATDRGMQSMGLDSLMAVELAAGLEQRTGVRLSAMMLQDSPTVDQIAERIVARLTGTVDENVSEDALLADLARRHAVDLNENETATILNGAVAEGTKA
ncbi:type I polyketide synthase [Desulfovibrio sp. ZJ369]|uniref:type I polyketide synthase n=1 Tax=Desulfovibrio sp. ZJ369 TaxID=2709793 RepID=UPI00240770A1|nr:type I polyketide synthase [Desulfovibrio sp. ZJ369]